MKDINAAPVITAFAEKALVQSDLLNNQYFGALKEGTMSFQAFQKSQQQFYFAVAYFPRPMASLLARIPDAAARLDILQNLVEEHGRFSEQAFHCNTFKKFLDTLARDDDSGGDTLELREHVAIKAFNAALNNACVLDELEVGIACMGIIEYSFARISALIGEAVIARRWIDSRNLVHYSHHSLVDSRHAEEFFAVIEPHWSDPRRRILIEDGIALGLYIFDRLYLELYQIGQSTKNISQARVLSTIA